MVTETILLKILIIFLSYGIVFELLQSSVHFYLVMPLNCIGLLHHISIVLGVIYAGSSATKEAERTKTHFSKVVNESILNDSEKINFLYFMSQLQARNVNLENALFKINWNVLLTVKPKKPLLTHSHDNNFFF